MLIAGKNKIEKFYLVNTRTRLLYFHYYNHTRNHGPWLKTNMTACVRLAMAMALLPTLSLAVLILYGDMALHIDPEHPQPWKKSQSTENKLDLL